MKLDEILKSEELTCAIPYADFNGMMGSIRESLGDNRERTIAFCIERHELSFPKEVGEPYMAPVPDCPAGKTKIGTFHTHLDYPSPIKEMPPKKTDKSVGDWYIDFLDREQISCVGAPEIKRAPEGVIRQGAIACHRFDIQHPEYEDFRERFLAASAEAIKCELKLVGQITEIGDKLRAEELAKYREAKNNVATMLQEGEAKGIISSCCPFSMPDVEGMLEEQR